MTRSNSTSLAKIGKASTPLFAGEFHHAVTETRNTRIECKSLILSLNKQFSELKTSVDLLSSLLAELRSKNSVILSDLTTLQKRVRTLETTSKNDTKVSQLIYERGKCVCNIVVHGLFDSIETSPFARITP